MTKERLGDFRIPFGNTYKGECLHTLWYYDRKYLEWIADEMVPWNRQSEEVKEKVQEFLEEMGG